jgi:hypothetical protein
MTARRRVRLVTFASEPFYSQQKQLNESAPNGGITDTAAWTYTQLKATAFYRMHREILDAVRGCGYWLWKPYLIRAEMERVNNGEFVVYYDVGRPASPHLITRALAPLLDWCERENGGMLPGVYVPEYGPNTRWIKRECFVLMDCDSAQYWEHPQVQATYSVWQKSDRTLVFLDEWLRWCTAPGVLTDETACPQINNFPDFVDHRHDQAVLTLLVIRGAFKAYGEPQVALPGSKDINNLVDRIQGRELALRWRALRREMQWHVCSRI